MDDVGIEKKNDQGDTALHLPPTGASDQDLKIAKTLVEACGRLGSDTNFSGEYPVYISAERGSLEIMEYLLKFPQFPTIGPDGKTALHAAVKRSKAGIFMYLLKERTELLTEEDDEGSTPLHYVASCGGLRMTQLLLKYGDDLATRSSDIEEDGGGLSLQLRSTHVAHICDKKGTSPIHVAAVMGNVGVIRLILESRPDACELVDKRGRNFLHVAVKYKRIEVVKYVIEESELKDLLTDQQDNNGDMPLHLAVSNHRLEIVRLLLKVEKLAKVLRNSDGMKPFDLAAFDRKSSHMEYRMFKMIKYLIISGAEFSARRLDCVEKTAINPDSGKMRKRRSLVAEPSPTTSLVGRLLDMPTMYSRIWPVSPVTLPTPWDTSSSSDSTRPSLRVGGVASPQTKVILFSPHYKKEDFQRQSNVIAEV